VPVDFSHLKMFRPVRGDLDGLLGLALDNLVQFLLIIGLCTQVLRFPSELIVSHVVPAAGLGLLAGNLAFAVSAGRVARRSGREQITALPYGISTVALFANVFLVMLPVADGARAAGLDHAAACLLAWRVGLAVTFLLAVGVVLGALVVEPIARATAAAALLSSLAGMALCFIAADFLVRVFDQPLVGMLPLGAVLACYASGVKAPLGVPAGAWALALGTLLAWALPSMGLPSPLTAAPFAQASENLGLYLPAPALADLVEGLTASELRPLVLHVVVPLVIANVLGSVQNLESAAKAGDALPRRESMLISGVCSLLAVSLGSVFPNTIYIGHPGFKSFGARTGYSWMNGVFYGMVTTTGLIGVVARVVPLEAGLAIMVWIGLMVLVQAMRDASPATATALALGLLPALAAWATLWVTRVLSHAGQAFGDLESPLSAPDRLAAAAATTPGLQGLVSLSHGFALSGVIWASVVLDFAARRFRRAALWFGMGAVLSFFGLIHVGRVAAHGVVSDLGWGTGWPWAAGYLGCALVALCMAAIARHRGHLSLDSQ
jgi:AGZA family xanthine/uracil permease-like MFS transporter